MIQSQPDVSIVIAAFNAAQTIDRAITSALAQQGVSLEVVVSDDRSTDTTLAVVRAIADPRIRIVALPENRGPGAARNAAIDAARGRWIAVLDADDTLLPERLARMIAKAEAAEGEWEALPVSKYWTTVEQESSPVSKCWSTAQREASPVNKCWMTVERGGFPVSKYWITAQRETSPVNKYWTTVEQESFPVERETFPVERETFPVQQESSPVSKG